MAVIASVRLPQRFVENRQWTAPHIENPKMGAWSEVEIGPNIRLQLGLRVHSVSIFRLVFPTAVTKIRVPVSRFGAEPLRPELDGVIDMRG